MNRNSFGLNLWLQRITFWSVKDLKCSWFYGIMVAAKKPPRAGACGSCEVEWVICGLRSDHNLDHLQVWTTWELWTLWHEKARFSDEKARKSTQNEAKNWCRAVWELDAAGSSPVTSTKTQNRGVFPPFCVLIKTKLTKNLFDACIGSFCTSWTIVTVVLWRKTGLRILSLRPSWLWKAIFRAFFFIFSVANFEGWRKQSSALLAVFHSTAQLAFHSTKNGVWCFCCLFKLRDRCVTAIISCE